MIFSGVATGECHGVERNDRDQLARSARREAGGFVSRPKSRGREVSKDLLVLSMRLREQNPSSWTEPGESFNWQIRRKSVVRVLERKENQAWEAQVEHLSHLASDEAAMPQSEEFRVPRLWQARNHGVRKMADVRELLCGYGRPSSETLAGQNRQFSRLFEGELPLGHKGSAGEQSANECLSGFRRKAQDVGRMVGSSRRIGTVHSFPLEQRVVSGQDTLNPLFARNNF